MRDLHQQQAGANAVAAVAAALAFVALQILGRAVLGAPDLAGVLEDLAVRVIPGAVFAWVLDHLLFLAKPLLYAVLTIGEATVLALAATIAAVRRRPLAGGLVLGLVGTVAALLDAPGPAAHSVAYYLSLAVAAAGYAALLAERAPRSGMLAGGRRLTRRNLLVAGIAAATTLVLGRRLLGPLIAPSFLHGALGAGTATAGSGPWAGMPALVTPASDFYIITKNLTDPVVDVATWHLRVHGLVEAPLDLDYAGILALPAVNLYRTLECISNPVGGYLISNGQFTGIALGDLLARVRVRPEATHLLFTSADGYFETMPLAQARSPLTLLAYGLDGQPLPVHHGFPLRVLGAGTYGMKNPKWLTDIRLIANAPQGFWERLGWNPGSYVRTMSLISVPEAGAQLKRGPVGLGGVAFAGDRGITRVEVSVDGGRTWQPSRLQGGLGPSTWVLWEHLWPDPAPGAHTLVVRATDGTGQSQPRAIYPAFPYGAMGLHTIQIHVL